MSTQAKKWIVRDDIGHIYGPFELTKLKDLLAKGILTGEEQTAQYPAGDWQPMSSEPELYNLILDSLSVEKKKPALVVALQSVKPKLQEKKEWGPEPELAASLIGKEKAKKSIPDFKTKSKEESSRVK